MYTYIMRINTFLKQKLLFAYTILEPFSLFLNDLVDFIARGNVGMIDITNTALLVFDNDAAD